MLFCGYYADNRDKNLRSVCCICCRFSSHQIAGVVLVTIGVIISTYSSANNPSTSSEPATSLREWISGIAILTLALFLASFLGQLQQWTYSKYGKHWREGLFYTHALGMPAFLLFWGDLREQAHLYSASEPVSVADAAAPWVAPFLSKGLWEFVRSGAWGKIVLPKLWLFLLLNTVTQCKDVVVFCFVDDFNTDINF